MTQAMTTQERATAKRNGRADHAATLVSGYALARHFGITRQAVDVLASTGVIERRPDDHKFDQDQSRLKYFAHLRSEHRKSPRLQADATFVAAKAEMLQIKIAQQRRELVRREDCDALIDQIAGVMLTGLSGLAARVSRDPVVRQNVEVAVRQIRIELAQTCELLGDRAGEPPLADRQQQAQETAAG